MRKRSEVTGIQRTAPEQQLTSSPEMCKQSKTGYTECPHVHEDGDIEFCEEALRPERDAVCDEVAYYWLELRVPGKCMWCKEKEKDDKEKKRRWGRFKSSKRPEWLL
ncbi:hypothetical protein N0V90_005056 [Kalmusia sp. IMI 367209]|nr:hypothetical protein N0V90_005056 [Kalmusia sp. IMI 367209]